MAEAWYGTVAEIRHQVAAFFGAILCPVQSRLPRYAAHKSWGVHRQRPTRNSDKYQLESV